MYTRRQLICVCYTYIIHMLHWTTLARVRNMRIYMESICILYRIVFNACVYSTYVFSDIFHPGVYIMTRRTYYHCFPLPEIMGEKNQIKHTAAPERDRINCGWKLLEIAKTICAFIRVQYIIIIRTLRVMLLLNYIII